MPKLTAVAPIFIVKDVVASANYWRDKLGFNYDQFFGEPPAFCMADRDGLTVMLQQRENSDAETRYWKICAQMWNAYFWVDDADALYEEFRSRGAIIDYEIGDKPYNVREFGIQDLDGHDIAFGQILRK